ncbi:MAG: major facilitator superfamily domain-containing protein 6 [Anaerolineaceae bacterium]|nr:major facilitator superfamily domain-containing protein 6 [Anaerolineaceae bacterium]
MSELAPAPQAIASANPPAASRRALNGVRGAYFLYYAAYGIFVTYINLYYQSIGLSGTQIGLINTLSPLVGIFSGTLWGMVNDRFGRIRLLLLLTSTGGILSVLGLSQFRTFLAIMPLAGLYSLFTSPIPPLLDNINLSILGSRRQQYGRQRIFGSIGYILTTWGFGLILQRIGLSYMFISYALILLVLCLALTWLPNQPVTWTQSLRRGLTSLVRQPDWIFFSASVFLLWMASSGMYNFLGIYLKQIGGTDSLVGLASSLTAISETPVMLFSAFLVGKFGSKRLLYVAFFLYAVRMLFYSLMPSAVWALPIALMHGSTFGFFWIASVTHVNTLAPENLKATSQGLFWTVMNLANVVGSPISGVLYDHIGPSALFRLFAGYCAAAFLLFVLWNTILSKRRARKKSRLMV